MTKLYRNVIAIMILVAGLAIHNASAQGVSAPAGASTNPPGSHPADSGSASAPAPQLQQRFPRYKVSPGDSMDLNFTFSPEFNQTVSVQPDGFINLKEVGDVQVQDQNTVQIAETVRKAYANVLRDPIVTVILKDFNKPYFLAGGEVHRPGKYELRERTTIAQAVQVAGGFTEAAKHSEVWLYHWLPDDRMEVKKINMKKMLSKGDLREDIRLQNGDMVFVPQNTFSKVKGVLVPRPSVTVRP